MCIDLLMVLWSQNICYALIMWLRIKSNVTQVGMQCSSVAQWHCVVSGCHKLYNSRTQPFAFAFAHGSGHFHTYTECFCQCLCDLIVAVVALACKCAPYRGREDQSLLQDIYIFLVSTCNCVVEQCGDYVSLEGLQLSWTTSQKIARWCKGSSLRRCSFLTALLSSLSSCSQ